MSTLNEIAETYGMKVTKDDYLINCMEEGKRNNDWCCLCSMTIMCPCENMKNNKICGCGVFEKDR